MWIQLCSLIHTRTQHTKNNPKPQTPTNLFSLSAFSKMCALDYNSKTPRSSGYLLALSRHAIVFKLSFFFSLSLSVSLSSYFNSNVNPWDIYIYTPSLADDSRVHTYTTTQICLSFSSLVSWECGPVPGTSPLYELNSVSNFIIICSLWTASFCLERDACTVGKRLPFSGLNPVLLWVHDHLLARGPPPPSPGPPDRRCRFQFRRTTYKGRCT